MAGTSAQVPARPRRRTAGNRLVRAYDSAGDQDQ